MKKDILNVNNDYKSPQKFKKMRKALQGISLSMDKASKNPRKYIDNQDMNIKNYKGVIS